MPSGDKVTLTTDQLYQAYCKSYSYCKACNLQPLSVSEFVMLIDSVLEKSNVPGRIDDLAAQLDRKLADVSVEQLNHSSPTQPDNSQLD